MKEWSSLWSVLLLTVSNCQWSDKEATNDSKVEIVMKSALSDQESSGIGSPSIVKVGTKYYMVYAQGNARASTANPDRHHKGTIGLAESTDGVTWEKKGTIFEPSRSDGWDDWFLDTPALLEKDGVFYLYYFGDSDNTPSGGSIGLAVSRDFVNWVRFGDKPILERGAVSDWDGHWIESPTVVFCPQDNKFHMFYTGVDREWKVRIGHAVSSDGYSWIKDPKNPVIRERNSDYNDRLVWDGSGAGVASAYYKEGRVYIFYVSQSINDTVRGANNPAIGLVETEDFRTYRRYSEGPVLTKSNSGNYINGPYNPAVIYDENRWKMWFETGVGFGYVELDGRM